LTIIEDSFGAPNDNTRINRVKYRVDRNGADNECIIEEEKEEDSIEDVI